jgi:hypothetical protein
MYKYNNMLAISVGIKAKCANKTKGENVRQQSKIYQYEEEKT